MNTAFAQNPYNTYKQNAVETATQDRLIIMLYNGAIKFLHQAEKAMGDKDISETNRLLLKVQDILSELMITLDLSQGEIALNLYQLYDFYWQETIRANLKKDPQALQNVLKFFMDYKDMWEQVSCMKK